MFESSIYKERRKKLKKEVGSGIILLLGNTLSPMNYRDNTYPFRQDSSFLYFFGINKEGLAGVIDIDKDQEILFGNEQTIEEIVWTGNLPSLHDLAQQAGISIVKPYASLSNYIIQHLGRIHYLPPYRAENRLLLTELLTSNTLTPSVNLIQGIVKLRSIKGKIEIEEIEKAVTLSEQIHEGVIKFCQPGRKEYELVAFLESIAAANNARMAYPTILTINGQTLHNHYHGNTIKSGDLVLCDAGVEIESSYCGDLTRTFPADKDFSTQQAAIYKIVLDAFETSLSLLKPGIQFKQVHEAACLQLTKGLTSLGLMKGNAENAVKHGAHTLFFQCGLGHMMGLDVHDMEDLGEEFVGYSPDIKRSTDFGTKFLRLARELQAGFVLTVEPGVYFIPQQIDLWRSENRHSEFINYSEVEKFKTFGGVRIEDNFLIEPQGTKQLGRKLGRTIAEIEKLRG